MGETSQEERKLTIDIMKYSLWQSECDVHENLGKLKTKAEKLQALKA